MENTSQQDMSASPSVDISTYVRILTRRAWLVVTCLVVVVAAAGVYTFRQKKLYQASASLVIEAAAPRVLDKVDDVMEPGASHYWFAKEFYQTQYKIMVSRAVAQRVVDKLGLQNDVAFLGLSHLADASLREAALQKADAAALLQSKIRIDPAKDSRVVNIIATDYDPHRAALLANELADAYIQENLSLRLRVMESASQWLEDRLTTLEKQTKDSEMAIYDFRKTADMLSTSIEDRQGMVSQRLNAANAALSEVRLTSAGLRAKKEAYTQLKKLASASDPQWADAIPGVANNSFVQQLKLRYSEQRAQCNELAERYLTEHPKRAECLQNLRSTEQDLLRELTRVLQTLDTELAETAARERNLMEIFSTAKAEAFEVNKKQIEFDRLKHESDSNRRLYDLVLRRLKDIELSGLLRVSNARVLDAARPVLRPVKPQIPQTMALAVLAGLFLGILGAIALEFLDNTIANQQHVEEYLQLPLLGYFPSIQDASRLSSVEKDLHIHRNPKSSVAECCRAIRTNLLFMSPERPSKTLLVTSSGPQDGKSTCVISLGIAMAQSGNRVLLLDTDMRKPRLHHSFGVPNDVGVSSLILDESRLDAAIKTTEVPGLFVLPCGPIPPNPSELLHTKAFADLLKKVGERFDKVVLDSPPIGAVADAAVLATLVDGVLLVLRAGKTSRDMAKHVVRALRGVKANLLGTVLNNVNIQDPKYGQYYYYVKEYGSYYAEPEGPN